MSITGDIIKKVRNRDNPSSTWFGGAEGVPSAFRSKPKTMMMRVKLVIISKMAGIKVSAVMKTSVCTGRDQLCPPPAIGVEIRPGNCAYTEGANRPRPASVRDNTRRITISRYA
ncbi:hypothetical protein D3C76_1378480 [compost metagenome]